MEAEKKDQQPPTPAISRSTKSRILRKPLYDRTNVLTSSKGDPFSSEANASGEAAPGTYCDPFNSVPSCDFPYSSGVEISRRLLGRPRTASKRKSKGKAFAISSTSSPSRRNNDVRSDLRLGIVDRTSGISSSKQVPFLPSLDDSRIKSIKGDATGTSLDVLGLDYTPLRDVPSNYGHGVASQTMNSNGKEILASFFHNERRSRMRKRPGEVEARAVSKSCTLPNRRVRKSSTEAGDRVISKSFTLPNKRKRHHPSPDTDEASKSFQEFIRQQKSYFAEIDAFQLPEEEGSIEDSE